jgi:hypothetical protein
MAIIQLVITTTRRQPAFGIDGALITATELRRAKIQAILVGTSRQRLLLGVVRQLRKNRADPIDPLGEFPVVDLLHYSTPRSGPRHHLPDAIPLLSRSAAHQTSVTRKL